jgi:hypothetical protein
MAKAEDYKHPMRDLEVIVYQRVEGGSGPLFIGKYEPFHVYPVFFQGDTLDEVKQKAKKFADDAVEKHEATYQVRKTNAEKARAARDSKKKFDESARSL